MPLPDDYAIKSTDALLCDLGNRDKSEDLLTHAEFSNINDLRSYVGQLFGISADQVSLHGDISDDNRILEGVNLRIKEHADLVEHGLRD